MDEKEIEKAIEEMQIINYKNIIDGLEAENQELKCYIEELQKKLCSYEEMKKEYDELKLSYAKIKSKVIAYENVLEAISKTGFVPKN